MNGAELMVQIQRQMEADADIFSGHDLIRPCEREHRNGHPACAVWLTGLSGSGKSTLARALEERLFAADIQAYVLDADHLRQGICRDLGYSDADRAENIRRVGEVARHFVEAGFVAVVACISPFRASRAQVRERLGAGRFVEVYVNAPIEVCERRDPKGLYAKARAREIREFTGISSPYEAPQHPDLELRTDRLPVDQSVSLLAELLAARGVFRREFHERRGVS